MGNDNVRALLYSRCSTDEQKQDVEIQRKELRTFAAAYGWAQTEVVEYGSGYKGDQPKLAKAVEDIRRKKYDILLVYSMDRFSRKHPKKVNALLDTIVYTYKCRFIAIQQSIDSDNEMIWNVVKPLFTYFANVFSQNLAEKVRLGIARKKELNVYNGGRPIKKVDLVLLRWLYSGCHSLRGTADLYNERFSGKRERISYVTVSKLLKNGKRKERVLVKIKKCKEKKKTRRYVLNKG